VLLHEAAFVALSASEIGAEAFACFQSINVLGVASHESATVTKDSDEFVRRAGLLDLVMDLLSERGDESVEDDGRLRVLEESRVEEILAPQLRRWAQRGAPAGVRRLGRGRLVVTIVET
jgi:hypothetical protein